MPTSCVPLAEASPILHPEVLPEWAIRGRRGSRNLVLQAGEAVCTQWWACGMGWGTLSHSGPSTHHATVSRLAHLQLRCDQGGPFPGAPHLSQPLPARPIDGGTPPTPPWTPARLGKGTWVAKKQMTPWCFQASSSSQQMRVVVTRPPMTLLISSLALPRTSHSLLQLWPH